MPLRFRSVVPYTLPGVLALIGWWWYISRKKERLTRHDSPEESPTNVGQKTSSEGSNGLLEKTTVSLRNEMENPALMSPKNNSQMTDHENLSQDIEAAPSLELASEEAASSRICDEAHRSSFQTQPSASKDDTLQVSLEDNKEPDRILSHALVKDLEKQPFKDPVMVEENLLPCQSTKVADSSLTAEYLSDAERPEPEGEVAKHSVSRPDGMAVCAVTPATAQREMRYEIHSLETPPSAQGFHKHIQTSALTTSPLASTPLTVVHDCAAASMSPEHIQVQAGSGEGQDLERVASGLITEVISAATQEVLGLTSCQVTDNSCNIGNQEPIVAAKQHHHLLTSPSHGGCESREAPENEEQGMLNGCSVHSHGVHQANYTQRGHLPTLSHPAAHGARLLNPTVKEDEAVVLTEDSACSTCHSEDCISSEDLQSSVFSNQVDVMLDTDYSAREATQSQPPLETETEASALADMEESSVGAVCEMKRLNEMGLRNGAGTSEVETDQSGGSDVNSMDSVDSGCTMGAGESQSNHTGSSNSELIVWEIEVPKHLVGRLIGKQGRYVSFLKQNSGAKIYISTLPYTQEFQICHIEGVKQQVDKALSLIGKKFKDLDLTNLYAPPPPPLTLPSLPMTSWLLLPSGVTVEVIVVNIVSAGHVFVQQHTHPTYHALRSLDQQMFLCYSQPGTPALPSPAEVGVICAAPAVEGAWWRAQVISFYKETNEVEIRYVDYGGYDRVKIDSLRQIRSDFVTLPFQGAEVLLDNIAPLPGEDSFSAEATSAMEELTRGLALLAQVSNYDNSTGLPLIHLWNMVGDEIMSVNRSLAERGVAVWVDAF